MHRIEIFTVQPLGRKCCLKDETAEHLIFDWEGTKTLESWTILTKGVTIPKDNFVRKILNFMEIIGLSGDVYEHQNIYY